MKEFRSGYYIAGVVQKTIDDIYKESGGIIKGVRGRDGGNAQVFETIILKHSAFNQISPCHIMMVLKGKNRANEFREKYNLN